MAERYMGYRLNRLYSQCKLVVALFILLSGLVNPLIAWGYVLQGPHLLELMAQVLVSGKTLKVEQTVTVEDPDVTEHPLKLNETLNYFFPERFRSDTKSESTHRIYVESVGQSITILDGHTISHQQDRLNLYKDLLLSRSRSGLHKMLLEHGVDVGVTSLGRYRERIVYVVGARFPDETVSQVWVDKESFLPLRWIIVSASGTDDNRLEFLYDGWQKKGNIWYPLIVEVVLNSHMVKKIEIKNIIVNPELSIQLFDIPYLVSKYPPAQLPTETGPLEPDPTDEVQRTIEEFQKRFED